MSKIKVMVVDDHLIVRTGIQRMLESDPAIEVVGSAASGEEALKLVETRVPNVVMMDVSLPGINGLEAMCRIKDIHPDIRVIGLSMHADGPYPLQFVESGGDGYLSKCASPQEMSDAVRKVMLGELCLSDDVACGIVMSRTGGQNEGSAKRLSRRELELLELIADGLDQAGMANRLGLSASTVRTYRHRLLKKMGAKNDVQLLNLARRRGLMTEPRRS